MNEFSRILDDFMGFNKFEMILIAYLISRLYRCHSVSELDQRIWHPFYNIPFTTVHT